MHPAGKLRHQLSVHQVFLHRFTANKVGPQPRAVPTTIHSNSALPGSTRCSTCVQNLTNTAKQCWRNHRQPRHRLFQPRNNLEQLSLLYSNQKLSQAGKSSLLSEIAATWLTYPPIASEQQKKAQPALPQCGISKRTIDQLWPYLETSKEWLAFFLGPRIEQQQQKNSNQVGQLCTAYQ